MKQTVVDFNSLELIAVERLLRLKKEDWIKFYVPSYQRGYRWSAEQVEQLIDDLMEFRVRAEGDSSAFYCLQPLVVKPINVNGTDYLEVVDGQQRLTTILIILQALHQIDYESFMGDGLPAPSLQKSGFSIKYETKVDSDEWLAKLGGTLFDKKVYDEFENASCDYSHFAEVFKAAYDKLKKGISKKFRDVLTEKTMFIWYYPTEESGENVDIFDRLNAGKISLNNAELIKALFLQRSNMSQTDGGDTMLQSLALEWDAIERRLNDKEFWGFIYSARHPYSYETHIEYLFDLFAGKTEEKRDIDYYTFNEYLRGYRNMMEDGGNTDVSKRRIWVEQKWKELKELSDTLNEWYADRQLYHRIGFILEYVGEENLLTLKTKLLPLSRTERIATLDKIIENRVSKIKSNRLFYGNSELSEILFLYNILLENRRSNKTARFSFADYKSVKKNIGWDQEHVASHIDYKIKFEDRKSLARDLIELITGFCPKETKDKDNGQETQQSSTYELDESTMTDLSESEKSLCEKLLEILNENPECPILQSELNSLYESLLEFMEGDKDDFGMFENLKKEEKDFIWNFVLLNSKTNRSYGNNIYAVKRKRILADEFKVYTPVGTRNVFEKAYSRRVNQVMSWTRTDALAYWSDIKNVLKNYVILNDVE